MSDVLYRATKYMNAEDALLTQEKRERQEDIDKTKGERWQELETLDGQKLHYLWNTKHLRNYYQ